MNMTEHCACENFEEFQYSVPPDTTHFTLHTLHLDELSSDYQDPDRLLYIHCTQNINGCEPVLGTAHCHAVWMSKRCNFMIISSTCFNIPIQEMQYLDYRQGLLLLRSKIPWGRHPGVEACSSFILVINCILLGALVIWYQLKETRLITQKIVHVGCLCMQLLLFLTCNDVYIQITSVSELAVKYWPYARCDKTKLCCTQLIYYILQNQSFGS